jgi:hypothetical protein
MNLDQNSIKRLVSLNDKQLRQVLQKLAADYGVDLSAFPLGEQELARIRSVLSVANPQDIQQFLNQFPDIQSRLRAGEQPKGE